PVTQAPLTGTFINQNHFAIYLGLALVATWGLVIANLKYAVRDHGLTGGRETMAKVVSVAMTLTFIAPLVFVLGSALLLTGSRAGLAVTVTGALLIILLEWFRSSRRPDAQARYLLIALGVVAVSLLLGLLLNGDLIAKKLAFASAESDWGARLGVARI